MHSRVCGAGRIPKGSLKAWSAFSESFHVQFLTCFQISAEVLGVAVCPAALGLAWARL